MDDVTLAHKFKPTPPAFSEMSKITGSLDFLPNSSIVAARWDWLIEPSNRLQGKPESPIGIKNSQPLDAFLGQNRFDEI
jgi:hypothetical protein